MLFIAGTTGLFTMFDLNAYRQSKAAAKAEALALKAKAEAKTKAEESTIAKAQAYADQNVSEPTKQVLFGEYHSAIGTESGLKRAVDKSQKAQDSIDADKKALAKLEADLDAIYENIVSLQDKATSLRQQTKADKAAVAEKLEEIKVTSVAERIAKARAKKDKTVSL